MGYLLGGRIPRIITDTSDTGFKQAQQTATIVPVPTVTPARSTFGIQSAQIASAMQRMGQAGGDYTRNAPLFNDPRYTSSTLAIPTDDRTLHGLYRFFAETDPIVSAALKLHTELPLADADLGQCEDTGVQQHFEEMWERINGLKLLNDIASEYHEIGNVYPFGAFNETDYMWEQFAILNPDYVKIETTWVNQTPLIKLVPDEALKRVVQTRSPRFIYDQLPPELVRYVLFNQEIPLDPNNVFMIALARRPYEAKGRSLIKRILKTLMLEDRFNQANFALATRHAVPLTVVKVGDPNSGWIPDQTEIDAVRDMFSSFELDPNFSIFYHYGINVEYYGSNGKMLPIGPELDRLYRLKFIGMGVHEQLLGGQGGNYSQAYVNLEVQRQRYLNLQLKLENFVHNGIFKPVADLCGFYRVKQAVSGPAKTSRMSWGDTKDQFEQSFLKAYTSVRDYKDNKEFRAYANAKFTEWQSDQQNSIREYVYPKIDWGQMSATTDENLKNYIKWLAEKRPYLVDDATLARLAKLDRDTQEKAYISDLERAQKRLLEVSQKGLLPFAQKGKGGAPGTGGGGAAPVDFGGIGDIGVGGGAPGAEGLMGGPTPPTPAGVGGPPAAAGAGVLPAGAKAGWQRIEDELLKEGQVVAASVVADDVVLQNENKDLLKQRSKEDWAIEKAVGG